jgi:DNA-binding response OmpR family regulator
VLIIDDEESVRVALRAILQSEYEILEADSASKALDLLKQHHADLVTLDVFMPGESGLDTLRHIRESKGALPVIMITGHASVDSACEALRLGATDYLQKPFGVEELKKSVRNSLRRGENPLPLLPSRNGKEPEPAESNLEGLARLGKASAAFVHDLASPLQVMTILTTLCGQKLESSPKETGELRDMVSQIERLLAWSTELVKGWQTIAVPSACARERIEVEPLLARVTEIVEPYARLNSVKLTCRPPAQPMEVVGDRVQIERALVNLSLNGIKASTSRGRTLEISARSFHDQHVFRFADTGLGFSPERMREVLCTDPFSAPCTKKRRGLGLFIADWIAVNHGGKLQFICDEGMGTTVEFFLPGE